MNKCSICNNESQVLLKRGNKLICEECLKPKCSNCDSKRLISISGKTSDCFNAEYDNKQYEGYVLTDIEIGDDSDYIAFKYCLECGMITIIAAIVVWLIWLIVVLGLLSPFLLLFWIVINWL
jgi:hypothetical protein